jgi:hypothetical protein
MNTDDRHTRDARAKKFENADAKRDGNVERCDLVAVRDGVTADGMTVRAGITRVRSECYLADNRDLFVSVNSERGQDCIRNATGTTPTGTRIGNADATGGDWHL